MIWDDATIKRMEKHWANGLSGSQIAKLLGTTRSAVLGKARRMGLPPRKFNLGYRITRKAINDNLYKTKYTVKLIKPKRNIVLAFRTTSDAVMALKDNICKYPHGEPGKPNFRFCLKPVARGSIYCPEHKELCFQPPLPRRYGAGKL